MSRQVQLFADHLLVTFSGMTQLAVMAGELRLPFSCIQTASAGPATMAAGAHKIAGVAGILSDTRHGHFRKDGDWYFFSFDSGSHVLNLELRNFDWHGRRYAGIALETDQPEQLAGEILRHL